MSETPRTKPISGVPASPMDLPAGRQPASRPAWLQVVLLLGLAGGAAVLALWLAPIPQDLAYHNFADQRTLLGINNFFNVASNIAFVIVGVLGLRFVLGRAALRVGGPFLEPAERWPFLLFFAGVLATGFSSSYYHLEPSNDRLVWDRLPMAVAFMALFAAVIAERVNLRLGQWLLLPLVAAGLLSVLYWHWTEQRDRGDLRFYYLVQFYSMLALPFLLLVFPPRYTRTVDLFVALGLYAAAKVCEHPLDAPLFGLGGLVSGHTLKHLLAALAAYWVLCWLRYRRPVEMLGPKRSAC